MSHICPGDCRQFRRSLSFWYLKTNILEMPITPTDAPQADLSTAKLGPKAGTKCVPQSHRRRGYVADVARMARPPRQPEMSQRGQLCGNSSQAAEEPMSAPDGQPPRDLHRRPAVTTCTGPHPARFKLRGRP
jgi:hypothetical protein